MLFSVLRFEDGRLLEIRDFRYALYVNEGADLTVGRPT